MGLETGTFIGDLDATNPTSGDPKSQGDDHLRLVKNVLKNSIKRTTRAFYFPTTVAKAVSYSVVAADDDTDFIVDSSAGAVVLTLPVLAALDKGWCCSLVKTTADVNAVSFAPPSGTINGAASIGVTIRYQSVTVIWDGSVFYSIVSNLIDGTITTAKIIDAAVTYAKIQNVAASRLLGNATGAPTPPTEIPLGAGLAFAAGALKLSTTTPTQQVFLAGTAATYTTPAGCTYIRVRAAGAGGGCSAQGNGGDTLFNAIVAKGGSQGTVHGGSHGLGGAGGTGGAGAANSRYPGQNGGPGADGAGNTGNPLGGQGGGSAFWGGGGQGGPSGVQGSAAANSGGGGGAGGAGNNTSTDGGGGGGECFELYIGAPAASYLYTVGAGTGGAAAGRIVVDEFYN